MPNLRDRLLGVAFLAFVLVGAQSPPAFAGEAVTWGKQTEVLSFDPQFSGDGASWDLFYLVYQQLLSTDDNYHLAPGLARSWEQLSPTSYRFHLASNAAFSNGRPLMADDVVGSFKRLTDPKTGGVWGKQLGKITAIVAEDDHTVRFDLEEPNTAFLNVLAAAPTSILPIKELNEGSFNPKKDILGSGPFMVVEHVQDQYWKLARNSHFWRKDRPLLDEFLIKILPNDSARIAALRDGLVDVATFDNADISRLLQNEPKIKVFKQNTTNYYRLDVNAKEETSPLSDKRVRQAMHYAIDRDTIANIVFAGEAKPEHPIPTGLGFKACESDPYYSEPRPERLAKARALLKEANKEGVEVGVIGSSALAAYPLIAQVIQGNLNEAGIQGEGRRDSDGRLVQARFCSPTPFRHGGLLVRRIHGSGHGALLVDPGRLKRLGGRLHSSRRCFDGSGEENSLAPQRARASRGDGRGLRPDRRRRECHRARGQAGLHRLSR